MEGDNEGGRREEGERREDREERREEERKNKKQNGLVSRMTGVRTVVSVERDEELHGGGPTKGW